MINLPMFLSGVVVGVILFQTAIIAPQVFYSVRFTGHGRCNFCARQRCNLSIMDLPCYIDSWVDRLSVDPNNK